MKGYLFRIMIAVSVLANVLLGGKPYQTLSARNYSLKRDKRFNFVPVIDKVLGQDHCLECWVNWKLRENGDRK